MKYRHVGDSGLVVSVVGLGCNNFGKGYDIDTARAVVDSALDEGITFLNTGDTYGRADGETTPRSEQMIGEVLKGRRDDVVISTKVGRDMFGANGPDWGVRGSRRYIRRAVERSLRQLQTDYIDLYVLHDPFPGVPLVETLSVLADLVREGKILYAGSSNHKGWQIADTDWAAREAGLPRLVSAENEYSWLNRTVEAEVLPACQRFGIGFVPYFPLANGLLTGKYRRGEKPDEGSRLARWNMAGYATEQRMDVVEKLAGFAAERGIGLLDVALGGLAAMPGVASVIAGATRPDQVKGNAAAGQWEPTAEELTILEDLAR